jgi:hypothetical protein
VVDLLLDDHRRPGGAADVEVENGATVSKRLAQDSGVDHEGDRVLATAVYDAEDFALPAQAARGAGSTRLALLDSEACCL